MTPMTTTPSERDGATARELSPCRDPNNLAGVPTCGGCVQASRIASALATARAEERALVIAEFERAIDVEAARRAEES